MSAAETIGWRLFTVRDDGLLGNPHIEQANMLAAALGAPPIWRVDAEVWPDDRMVARCALPRARKHHRIDECTCGIHAILDPGEFAAFAHPWLTTGLPAQLLEDNDHAALVRPWITNPRTTHAIARLELAGRVVPTGSPVDLDAWPSTVRAERARVMDLYVHDAGIRDLLRNAYNVPVHVMAAHRWPSTAAHGTYREGRSRTVGRLPSLPGLR